MCSPILNPLPTSLLSHPSGLSQSTGFECPVLCMELALVIYFTHGDIHVSMLENGYNLCFASFSL